MSELWKVYADNIKDNFKLLFANWPPNFPVAPGDFGTLQSNVFNRQGNLTRHFGVAIPISDGQHEQADYSYVSSDSAEIVFHPRVKGGGGGVEANASMTVTFSSENAVFFQAAGCTAVFVEDEVALSRNLLDLLVKKQWNEDWVVVTKVIRSAATTILISGAKSSSIVLEADATVPTINIADGTLSLTVKSQKNIGYTAVTKAGMSPLLGFSKVAPSFWPWNIPDYIGVGALPKHVTPYDAFEVAQLARHEGKELSDVFHIERVTA